MECYNTVNCLFLQQLFSNCYFWTINLTCVSLVRAKFVEEFTLRSMRLKPEKWAKLVISDEQRRHLEAFLDTDNPQILIISQVFIVTTVLIISVLDLSLFLIFVLILILFILIFVVAIIHLDIMLTLSQNIGGQLQIHTEWPTPLR